MVPGRKEEETKRKKLTVVDTQVDLSFNIIPLTNYVFAISNSEIHIIIEFVCLCKHYLQKIYLRETK